MQRGSRIYVAGGGTMIGRAIVRRLEAEGLQPIAADEEPDYRDRAAVETFLERVAGGIGEPIELLEARCGSTPTVVEGRLGQVVQAIVEAVDAELRGQDG